MWRTAHQRRMFQPIGRHPHHRAINPACIRESLAGDHGREPAVEILGTPSLPAAPIMVVPSKLVEMATLDGVDLFDIIGACRIPRGIIVAGSQREPADIRSPIRAATGIIGCVDEGDQCGGIDRVGYYVARHPAPTPVDIDPAAVMKWCKAPGLVVDPGPAPRLYRVPVAIPIGRPVIGD